MSKASEYVKAINQFSKEIAARDPGSISFKSIALVTGKGMLCLRRQYSDITPKEALALAAWTFTWRMSEKHQAAPEGTA